MDPLDFIILTGDIPAPWGYRTKVLEDLRYTPGIDDVLHQAYWRLVKNLNFTTEPWVRQLLGIQDCFVIGNIGESNCRSQQETAACPDSDSYEKLDCGLLRDNLTLLCLWVAGYEPQRINYFKYFHFKPESERGCITTADYKYKLYRSFKMDCVDPKDYVGAAIYAESFNTSMIGYRNTTYINPLAGSTFGAECLTGSIRSPDNAPIYIGCTPARTQALLPAEYECQPKACSDDPWAGDSSGTSGWDGSTKLVGTRFNYTCPEGKVFEDLSTGILENLCSGDPPAWTYPTSTSLTCEDGCLPPLIDENTINPDLKQVYPADHKIELTCVEGFVFKPTDSGSTSSSSVEITCNPSDTAAPWGVIPMCTVPECADPPAFTDVDLEDDTESRSIGATVRYRCSDKAKAFQNADGKIFQTTESYCKSDLTWSVTAIDSCAAVTCSNPPVPDAMHNLELVHNPDFPTLVGDRVKYSCVAGGPYNRRSDNFSLADYYINCTAPDTYETPEWPTCIGITECPLPSDMIQNSTREKVVFNWNSDWDDSTTPNYLDRTYFSCKYRNYKMRVRRPDGVGNYPNWRLILRQNVTAGFFGRDELSKNADNRSAENYAILDKLETFRRSDSLFLFKVWYPELTMGNTFVQESNPLTSDVGLVTGYNSYKMDAPNGFRGLSKGEDSLLEGSNSWFRAGTFLPLSSNPGAIAGPVSEYVTVVEVYVGDDYPAEKDQLEALCTWSTTWMFGNTDTACYKKHCETSHTDLSIFLDQRPENWCEYGYKNIYTQSSGPTLLRKEEWGYTTEVRTSVSSVWTAKVNMTEDQRMEAEIQCRWLDGVHYHPDQVECQPIACDVPNTTLSETHNYNITWDPSFDLVPINASLRHPCNEDHYLMTPVFFKEQAQAYVDVVCRDDGFYFYPDPFPGCYSDTECPEPNNTNPEIEIAESSTSPYKYSAVLSYTCKDPRRSLWLTEPLILNPTVLVNISGHEWTPNLTADNQLWLVVTGGVDGFINNSVVSCSFGGSCNQTQQAKKILEAALVWFGRSRHVFGDEVLSTKDAIDQLHQALQAAGGYDLKSNLEANPNVDEIWSTVWDSFALYEDDLFRYNAVYEHLPAFCQWSQSWSINPDALDCVIKRCGHPYNDPGNFTPPSEDHDLILQDDPVDGWFIEFNKTIEYRCPPGYFFENDSQVDPLNDTLTLECEYLQGTYILPEVWPNCTETVSCGPPPPSPINGSRTFLYGKTDRDTFYDNYVKYLCVNGSQFNISGDIKFSVTDRCQWNKKWHPYDPLPPCVITHCVDPPLLPVKFNLAEDSPSWVEVGQNKTYTCKGLSYWETDRSKTTFSMLCQPDGTYLFDGIWPNCTEDIICSPQPPAIPTNSEYTLEKDDGNVLIQHFIYPQRTTLHDGVQISTFNQTLIPRNFNANLTYDCGSARRFQVGRDTYQKYSIRCQWNKEWTKPPTLHPCVWVACLKPPTPPDYANLVSTDWDGEPIPFGNWTKFICKRGYKFEEEPERASFEVECMKSGFFKTPKPAEWPKCVLGPLCPDPPEPPFEGKRIVTPLITFYPVEEGCGIDNEEASLKCPTFQSIYIKSLSYGRLKSESVLCNGAPSSVVTADCVDTNSSLPTIRAMCHGNWQCKIAVNPSLGNTGATCATAKKHLRVNYTCVICSDWSKHVSTPTCLDSVLLMNEWIKTDVLANMTNPDKKLLVTEMLAKTLDKKEHGVVELSGRLVTAPIGGLCGMGMLYKALHDTIMTPSQLLFMGLNTMRSRMMEEMGLDTSIPQPTDDEALLADYFNFMCKNQALRRKRSLKSEPLIRGQRMARTKREAVPDDVKLYGNTLTYECGLAREFLSVENRTTYLQKNMTCLWNKTWTPDTNLSQCVWVACINPPEPPPESQMLSTWNGIPVNFTYNASYVCASNDVFYEYDKQSKYYNVTCLTTGGWAEPHEWPMCLSSVNCTSPPERPSSGTWEWNRSHAYRTNITYTCGPYGKFLLPYGNMTKEVISTCAWNKSWTPNVLPACKATSCPIIPFPPSYTGMTFIPDPMNSFSPLSEFRKYGQKMPSSLPFLGPDFCSGGKDFLTVIGRVTSESKRYSADIVFYTKTNNESFHVSISLGENTVYRYFTKDGQIQGKQGQPYDGTSIDLDEPFVIKISCDDDGWVLKVNEEEEYPTIWHQYPLEEIDRVEFSGKFDMSFAGFIPFDEDPVPAINFNITFGCPTGQVFSKDWLAIPTITMTCQEDGSFDEPDNWEEYICVEPTTTECYDCTTTTTSTTTTDEPTTLPADEMLYTRTTDYHWERFDRNATKAIGGWKSGSGLGQGALGFGRAIYLKSKQCLYDTSWMLPQDGHPDDPCMINPKNCTEGITLSVWDKMTYVGNILSTQTTERKYIISTGGEFNKKTGESWPGYAIYHEGKDIVAMVSTGEKVWALQVSGLLYNNTWTEIAMKFILPNLNNPSRAETPEGLEAMGGLEMYINAEKVGHALLPELTLRGSSIWTEMDRLTEDGTPDGKPVMMIGCHQNADMQKEGEFTGFAGSDEYPALIDEVSIWRRRLKPYENPYMLGGYSPELSDINPGQLSAMMNNIDLNDPAQALLAQSVVQNMLMGPAITTPRFPTRTPLPTTTIATTEDPSASKSTASTTTGIPHDDTLNLMRAIISRQNVLSSMLDISGVGDGQDPEDVEGRFSMAKVSSAILAGTAENKMKWRAVEEDPQYEGAMKTAREMEKYMLAWVGAVNISADRADDPEWKTNYFDSLSDSMSYKTQADDMVLQVDKVPIETLRADNKVRVSYPDYDGWHWLQAKAKWKDVRDNFSVPTGMFRNTPGCEDKPLTILTAVYNGLPDLTARRRNPVNIRSRNFRIDSKVISVRASINADPMEGDITKVYDCHLDENYMKYDPVKIQFFHKKPEKARRSLVWHSENFWEGLEVRHCVWWNERFGTNGAWDDTGCTITATNDEQSSCECSNFGSYAVLAELLAEPNMSDKALWILLIKWIGIILGTILLTVFIAVVFLSVVVGEMFHQIRMWCCFSYMVGNILILLSDIGVCDDRHTNIAMTILIMFFYLAALCWNTCEAHATFRGITGGIINGRMSVYHPIAWGLPLICIGGLCFLFGDAIGTSPNCFISWDKTPIAFFFIYTCFIFLFTIIFNIFVIFNVMRVQSHNRETVQYLQDQVKGLLLTSLLMMVLWLGLGSLANLRTSEMDLIDLMPAFQICNGWFGVILFLTLGLWSRRFRIGLKSQAEEKRKRLEAMKDKYGQKEDEDSNFDTVDTVDTISNDTSRPVSAATNMPTDEENSDGSRPCSSLSNASKSDSVPASRRASASASRPATATSSASRRSSAAPGDEDVENPPDPDEEE